jgi:hypothetical protein
MINQISLLMRFVTVLNTAFFMRLTVSINPRLIVIGLRLDTYNFLLGLSVILIRSFRRRRCVIEGLLLIISFILWLNFDAIIDSIFRSVTELARLNCVKDYGPKVFISFIS